VTGETARTIVGFVNDLYLHSKNQDSTMPSQEEKIFSFRVPETLKKAFKRSCKARDRSMSQKLRDYMRAYVAEHSDEMQYDIEKEIESLDV
jgi:hypothetical protein